jgi:hypothetical protein
MAKGIPIVTRLGAIAALLLLACTASAETVLVKYRGPVNLAKFACRNTESSVVHRICYRADRQYLVALLGGEYYHYCGMPPALVRQWLAAPSLGRFYNSSVKGSYDCRSIGAPAD